MEGVCILILKYKVETQTSSFKLVLVELNRFDAKWNKCGLSAYRYVSGRGLFGSQFIVLVLDLRILAGMKF